MRKMKIRDLYYNLIVFVLHLLVLITICLLTAFFGDELTMDIGSLIGSGVVGISLVIFIKQSGYLFTFLAYPVATFCITILESLIQGGIRFGLICAVISSITAFFAILLGLVIKRIFIKSPPPEKEDEPPIIEDKMSEFVH